MHAMMDPEQILEHAKAAEAAGAHRFCMVTQGQGLSKRDFEKIVDGARLVAEHTNLKRCVVDRPHLGRSRQAACRRGRPARPPQRRDLALLLPGGDDHGPLRGPHAHDRRGQGSGAGDLRRRHPQPWRVAPPAGRDGVRAVRDRSHLGAHQPAQPEVRDQVRRPAADGPVGGRQVGGDLPADPPGRPLPPLRWAGREPRRAATAGRQGGPQRSDDGELPDHARAPSPPTTGRCSRSWD